MAIHLEVMAVLQMDEVCLRALRSTIDLLINVWCDKCGRVGWQIPLASLTMVEIPWENSQYPSVEYLFGCMLNITLKYSWQSCIILQCHCNSVTAPPVAFQSCCIEKIEVSICGAEWDHVPVHLCGFSRWTTCSQSRDQSFRVEIDLEEWFCLVELLTRKCTNVAVLLLLASCNALRTREKKM